MDKCRYCDTIFITNSDKNNKHSKISCTDKYCMDYYSNNCKNINKCGHQCYNYKNNSHHSCVECLDKNCVQNGLVSESDLCIICQYEPLKAKPVIKLECNHYAHYECLMNIIKSG